MAPTTALLEPSFLDLIAAIEQAAELSEQRRRLLDGGDEFSEGRLQKSGCGGHGD